MIVKQTRVYERKASKLLDLLTRQEIADHLARNPLAGVVVSGSGGIRKLRWAASGRGKRGGARIIYFHLGEPEEVHLLTLYAKNEQSDLTEKDKKAWRQYVQAIKRGEVL